MEYEELNEEEGMEEKLDNAEIKKIDKKRSQIQSVEEKEPKKEKTELSNLLSRSSNKEQRKINMQSATNGKTSKLQPSSKLI